MKTYQIQIEDDLLPELKRILGFLPKDGVKLFSQSGSEIHVDTDDFESTDEFKAFIDEGITELDRGEGIPHEQVVAEMQAKYPNLIFKR